LGAHGSVTQGWDEIQKSRFKRDLTATRGDK
jgi:hypothetical protein